MKLGAVGFLAAVFLGNAVRGEVQETISSLDQGISLLRETQASFWMLVPPSLDPLYVHSDRQVRVVDWTGASADWPAELVENIYARVLPAGTSGAEYPFCFVDHGGGAGRRAGFL